MTSQADSTFSSTENHKSGQWLRILPLLFFGLIAYIVLVVYFILSAVQFVVVIVDDKPNSQLQAFGGRLGGYMKSLLDYLLYRTDQMPFPFAAFPHETTEDEVIPPAD